MEITRDATTRLGRRVLVAYATKMGSTVEIAIAIGEELTEAGCQVWVQPIDKAPDARKFDAVVLGSAVNHGRWRRDAVAYLKHQAPDLAERPVWLFQSSFGAGAPNGATTDKAPRAVHRLCTQAGLDPPQTFGAEFDPHRVRDHQIRSWAQSIATQLSENAAANELQPAGR